MLPNNTVKYCEKASILGAFFMDYGQKNEQIRD